MGRLQKQPGGGTRSDYVPGHPAKIAARLTGLLSGVVKAATQAKLTCAKWSQFENVKSSKYLFFYHFVVRIVNRVLSTA